MIGIPDAQGGGGGGNKNGIIYQWRPHLDRILIRSSRAMRRRKKEKRRASLCCWSVSSNPPQQLTRAVPTRLSGRRDVPLGRDRRHEAAARMVVSAGGSLSSPPAKGRLLSTRPSVLMILRHGLKRVFLLFLPPFN